MSLKCFGNFDLNDSRCGKCESRGECKKERFDNILPKIGLPLCFGKRDKKDDCSTCCLEKRCKQKYSDNKFPHGTNHNCFGGFDVGSFVCMKCESHVKCKDELEKKESKFIKKCFGSIDINNNICSHCDDKGSCSLQYIINNREKYPGKKEYQEIEIKEVITKTIPNILQNILDKVSEKDKNPLLNLKIDELPDDIKLKLLSSIYKTTYSDDISYNHQCTEQMISELEANIEKIKNSNINLKDPIIQEKINNVFDMIRDQNIIIPAGIIRLTCYCGKEIELNRLSYSEYEGKCDECGSKFTIHAEDILKNKGGK